MATYSLIPASRYCGLSPQDFIVQVKRGHMASPSGAHRWHEIDLDDWIVDHLRTPIAQDCKGHDGAWLGRAEVITLTGLTGKELERRSIAGNFPKQVSASSYRMVDVESFLLGMWPSS